METKKTVINALVESEPFSFQNDNGRERKVAAYCRVSTDEDEQKNSYENQVKEWTERISRNPNYTLYKVYGDEGVTGTDTAQRTGFQELISDAESGKFDLILCKSISRFGRNALITLSTIRHLKEIGVEVFFDNENMSTFDPKNEFMFTIMSSMAQEESRHISENVKWTFKRLMEKGNAFGPGPYGYKLGEKVNGIRKLEIVPEEAEVVRNIFEWYDSGFGIAEIARKLDEQGVPTKTKKPKWSHCVLTDMLKNEAYKGTLILQKTYTVDYIGHRRLENRGQKKTFVFKHAHEAIISEKQWDRVNNVMKDHYFKASGGNIHDIVKYSSRGPLSSLIICGKCGHTFKRRTWSGKGFPVPKIYYQCPEYINNIGEARCKSPAISEDILNLAIADMFNNLYAKKNQELKYLKDAFIEKHRLKPVNHELDQAAKLLDATRKRLKEVSIQMAVDEDQSESLSIEQDKLLENVHTLEKTVKSLKTKKSTVEIKNKALTPVLDVIKGKKVTAEDMKTFPIQSVIEYIRVVDKTRVVFVIDVSRTLSRKDIRNKSIFIGMKKHIFTNTVKTFKTTRHTELTYFVRTV